MTTVGNGDLVFEPVAGWEQLPSDVQIHEAVGVTTDSRDRVYVFNRGDPPVIVLDRNGQFLHAWGSGQFTRPHGIWMAADDTLYLVDDLGHSVGQFTTDGMLLRSLGPGGVPSDSGAEGFDFRTMRCGAPPYNLPTNAVTSSNGDIFVADGYGNARVHRFSANGELVSSWGEPGSDPAQFQVPHGIGIDREDRLYVADRENSRIQIFDMQGNLITQWTDVVRPCQVFVGADDLVYVAELGSRHGLFPWMKRRRNATGSRLSIFDRNSELLCRWGGHEDARQSDTFFAAHDICVDSHGSIYVAEVSRTAAEAAGQSSEGLPTLRVFRRP